MFQIHLRFFSDSETFFLAHSLVTYHQISRNLPNSFSSPRSRLHIYLAGFWTESRNKAFRSYESSEHPIRRDQRERNLGVTPQFFVWILKTSLGMQLLICENENSLCTWSVLFAKKHVFSRLLRRAENTLCPLYGICSGTVTCQSLFSNA